MEKLFLTVLGMSATGSAVILLVLAARLLLRKAPKAFSYALWAVVLFRLLCPFSIPSPVGVVLPVQVKSAAEGIETYTGGTGADVPAPDPGPPAAGAAPGASARAADGGLSWRKAAVDIWLGGTAFLLWRGIIALFLLRRGLVGSVPLEGEKNVWLADHIPSPFVLGLVRPNIYLPSDLPESEREYILLHERTHIRRFDHVTRALAWLALAVHWFNPLVWLAFRLAGRDMEMSCDEAVLRGMGRDVRADYCTSLLRLSVGGKLPAGPLAFGGGDLRGRIKNALGYKKPALWVMALALTGVLCAGTALATNPQALINPDSITSAALLSAGSYEFRIPPEDQLSMETAYVPEENDADELIRLINSHRKSIYAPGPEAFGGLDNCVRLDCADGGCYLLHYWYCSGFTLPYGEDDYYTLVTCYDAGGNAGTTWKMEYAFDGRFQQWLYRQLWYSLGEDSGEQTAVDGEAPDLGAADPFPEGMVTGGQAGGADYEVKVQFPPSSIRVTPAYSLDETGTGVVISGLNCGAAVWRTGGGGVTTHLASLVPDEPPLGCLTIEDPRFLGGLFKKATGTMTVLYYPGAESFQLFSAFEGHIRVRGDNGLKRYSFLVDLATGIATNKEWSGFPSRFIPFEEDELLEMGRALAQLVQGSAEFYRQSTGMG